jgi:hypothetical protein
MAATDFCTVEVLEEKRLERYHILIFIDIKTRKAVLGGIRIDALGGKEPDGFLKSKKYLIHDRDTLLGQCRCRIHKAAGRQDTNHLLARRNFLKNEFQFS